MWAAQSCETPERHPCLYSDSVPTNLRLRFLEWSAAPIVHPSLSPAKALIVEDIFVYAAKCVENKGVLARIGHSAKLHAARSAVSSKGSAASKFGALVGAGIRATVNAIPIPVIGGLVGALEQKV